MILKLMLLDAQEFCYGRETGNDEATIKRLINDEHWSMFRHGTYYIIANDSDKTLETIIINYANTIGFSYHYEKHVYYITVNGNWVLDHKTPFGYLSKYIVPIEDFCNTEIGFHMMRYTFCVDTQIRCKDDKEVTLLCKYVKNKHIGNCPNCIFNKYLCYGLLCNIVVLKVIKDEEK